MDDPYMISELQSSEDSSQDILIPFKQSASDGHCPKACNQSGATEAKNNDLGIPSRYLNKCGTAAYISK